MEQDSGSAATARRGGDGPHNGDAYATSPDTSAGVASIVFSRLNHDLHDTRDVAQGAFGVVKCAVLDADRQRYAVKESKKPIVSEGDLQQCLQEVYALSACHSPHVVRYSDAWVENRSLYVLTEWVDGGTAAQLPRPLAEVHVRALLHQMACALHHLHTRGIVHGDVKPDNILVHSCARAHGDGVVADSHDDLPQPSPMLFKLCDFGLSRRRQQQQRRRRQQGHTPCVTLADDDDDDNDSDVHVVDGAHAVHASSMSSSSSSLLFSAAAATTTAAVTLCRTDAQASSPPPPPTTRSYIAVHVDDGDRDYLCPEALRRGGALASRAYGGGDGNEHALTAADDDGDHYCHRSHRTTTTTTTQAVGECRSVDDAAAAADVYALGATCVTLMGGRAAAVREGVYTGAFASYSSSLQAMLRAMTAATARARPCARDVAIATLPAPLRAHAALQQRHAALAELHARLHALDAMLP